MLQQVAEAPPAGQELEDSKSQTLNALVFNYASRDAQLQVRFVCVGGGAPLLQRSLVSESKRVEQ